jgi:hypothetical protein
MHAIEDPVSGTDGEDDDHPAQECSADRRAVGMIPWPIKQVVAPPVTCHAPFDRQPSVEDGEDE